jgi:hypothetical protein
MTRTRAYLMAGFVTLTMGLMNCSRSSDGIEDVGTVELSLTRAPADASCLRVTVMGPSRSITTQFSLTPGQSSTFMLEKLPVGSATFSAVAFGQACNAIGAGSIPTWSSDAVVASIKVVEVTHVALRMVQNGRATVGVDFDPANGASAPPPPANLGPAVCSSQAPYVVPVAPGVITKAILTVGDSANLKPDGITPYRMVGIPDGLGAFDNGNGLFTLLSNHELTNGAGIARAHGSVGAFVSRWIVRKSDLCVLHGEDLIQTLQLWNTSTSSYGAGTTAMSRLCSADLPARSAFYDAATGLGHDGRLFMDGEESGTEGRAFAHGQDGTSWELPRLGKLAFENSIACPAPGPSTIVAGTDDGQGGQVYIYVGTKTGAGTPIEKAGLANGLLYGLKVTGFSVEDATTGIPTAPFTLEPMGNVENSTGAALDAASVAVGVTTFNRPEDAAWDPSKPSDLYFVTTASFTGNSRLWRARFTDIANPVAGGTIEMLLAGAEGQKMMDNIAVDKRGHIMIVEDVGNNAHLGRVLRYDIATDTLSVVAQHDPNRFLMGGTAFLTQDEEASGIIDASDLLGDGWFLLDVQAHYNIGDPELVEGGQYLALFDPATLL